MSNHKPVAIVLGGTEPHVTLVKNLQNRGYYVSLLDYLENPPAKRHADAHERISTLDSQAVHDHAIRTNASLVLSLCIDQANVTACNVSEIMKLPVPYPCKTAKAISNKIEMKRFMCSSGIPTSPFEICDNLDSIDLENLAFPVVVKPADCTGSKGVVTVSDYVALHTCLAKALELSRCGLAVIENHVQGLEVQVDFFIRNGKAMFILSREKVKANSGNGGIEQTLGSIIPAELTDAQIAEFTRIAQIIADGYQLCNTPLFIQAIMRDGKINLIEFAPRIGGGLSYRVVKMATQFDLLDAAVASLVGDQVDFHLVRPSRFLATRLIYAEACIMGHVEGQEPLLTDGTILEFHQYHYQGSKVGDELTSRNRIASFIVDSESKHGVLSKLTNAEKHIRVLDFNGKNVMRRNLNLF
jgi:biotin carboxylase